MANNNWIMLDAVYRDGTIILVGPVAGAHFPMRGDKNIVGFTGPARINEYGEVEWSDKYGDGTDIVTEMNGEGVWMSPKGRAYVIDNAGMYDFDDVYNVLMPDWEEQGIKVIVHRLSKS
jgi:hypothetical protein